MTSLTTTATKQAAAWLLRQTEVTEYWAEQAIDRYQLRGIITASQLIDTVIP